MNVTIDHLWICPSCRHLVLRFPVVNPRGEAMDLLPGAIERPGRFGLVEDVRPACVPRAYALVSKRSGHVEVVWIGVLGLFRGRGLGRALVGRIWLDRGRGRDRLVARVRETDADAVAFWCSLGGRAATVDRAWYGDTGEDAYRFEVGPRLAGRHALALLNGSAVMTGGGS